MEETVAWPRLDARHDERFPAVREQHDVARLELRRGMLEESEVVAVVGVEAVSRRLRAKLLGERLPPRIVIDQTSPGMG